MAELWRVQPATRTWRQYFPYSANPGDSFEGFDNSTNLDWMPNEHILFRMEYVHHQSNVNYFAGHRCVTSPNGYTTNARTPDWKPDLVKFEDRLLFAVLSGRSDITFIGDHASD